MTPGGEGIYPGFKHSEESKEKMRIASIGRIKSPETCKKLSQSKMGHFVSEEARQHMSLSHIGLTYPARSEASRQRSSEAQPKKPIICIETGIIYERTSIAAKALNIGRSAICNCLNGFSETAGGYH